MIRDKPVWTKISGGERGVLRQQKVVFHKEMRMLSQKSYANYSNIFKNRIFFMMINDVFSINFTIFVWAYLIFYVGTLNFGICGR